MFLIKICFEIIMGKRIGCIHKHSHQKWIFPPPDTNYFIPQHPDHSTQTQCTSYCDASVGAHSLIFSVLDQITSNHVNTDFINNNGPQSFEKYRKIITVIPLLVIKLPLLPH